MSDRGSKKPGSRGRVSDKSSAPKTGSAKSGSKGAKSPVQRIKGRSGVIGPVRVPVHMPPVAYAPPEREDTSGATIPSEPLDPRAKAGSSKKSSKPKKK